MRLRRSAILLFSFFTTISDEAQKIIFYTFRTMKIVSHFSLVVHFKMLLKVCKHAIKVDEACIIHFRVQLRILLYAVRLLHFSVR